MDLDQNQKHGHVLSSHYDIYNTILPISDVAKIWCLIVNTAEDYEWVPLSL